jgi:hypothetical protein
MLRPLIPALVLLAVLPAAAQARSHHVKRPHLTVSRGRVAGVGTGRVAGTFTVANTGDARARKSTARLSVKSSSKRWTSVRSYRIPALKPRTQTTITFTSVGLPSHLPARTMSLRVCDGASCRTVGTTRVRPASSKARSPGTTTTTTTPSGSSAPGTTTPATTTPPPARPADTTPPHPVAYTPDTPTDLTDPQSDYWIYVPHSYDATHRTPTELFVWMHGCYNLAGDDINDISSPSQAYITVSVGGRDNDCWNAATDSPIVLAAIAGAEDHFNIDQRRIVIGGYSSGGELAYRTAFFNAYTFAGVLVENTQPFHDTGATAQQSIAAAAWRFPIVHLAHTSDEAYNYSDVQSDLDQLSAAGFPVTRVTRPGTHHDANTVSDMQQYLLPHLNDGWTAP